MPSDQWLRQSLGTRRSREWTAGERATQPCSRRCAFFFPPRAEHNENRPGDGPGAVSRILWESAGQVAREGHAGVAAVVRRAAGLAADGDLQLLADGECQRRDR